MNINSHETIICTSRYKDIVNIAYEQANKLFKGYITNIISNPQKKEYSFMIVLNTISEYFSVSELWKEKRKKFIDCIKNEPIKNLEKKTIKELYYAPLETYPYKEESLENYISFIDVSFGGEQAGGKILETSKYNRI